MIVDFWVWFLLLNFHCAHKTYVFSNSTFVSMNQKKIISNTSIRKKIFKMLNCGLTSLVSVGLKREHCSTFFKSFILFACLLLWNREDPCKFSQFYQTFVEINKICMNFQFTIFFCFIQQKKNLNQGTNPSSVIDNQ
jgi:hypothetical protein